jgi:hypothetical protein
MTRQEVLGDAIVRPPHPKYGKLSYGRWERIKQLTKDIPEEDHGIANGIAWVVCTRDRNDTALVAACASSDPVAVLREIFEEDMHATEAGAFLAWFSAEMGAADAASTTAKEQSGPGKSDEAPQPSIPTS